MSDFHEVRDPKREPQIDTLSWVFLARSLGITALAAVIAIAPVSHG